MSTVDLIGMETLVRVAEARSFSEAARRLGVSKSVVSKHVARLEQRLGVRLLNRNTRSLSLTEAGEQFCRRCSEILAAAEEAQRQALDLQGAPRGLLRVAAPVTFGMLDVAPSLPELMRRWPELQVDLTLTDREVNLVEEGFDAAVLVDRMPSAGVVARPLASMPRCICASPDYLVRRGRPHTADALAGHECILHSTRAATHKWTLGGDAGLRAVIVKGGLRVNDVNAIRLAALEGAGLALLPRRLVAADLSAGRLHEVLSDQPPEPATLYVTYAANRHVAAKVRAFTDFAVERFGEVHHAKRPNQAPTAPTVAATP